MSKRLDGFLEKECCQDMENLRETNRIAEGKFLYRWMECGICGATRLLKTPKPVPDKCIK